MQWCAVCGTRHGAESPCPGELLATGPERHAWRITVDTPHGTETFGVLVAPSGAGWRARLLTYPRALWSVPGGKVAMKFLGNGPQECEREAIAYLERFCAERGYARHEVPGPVDAGGVAAEQAPDAGPAVVRKSFSARVRFGHTRPSQDATTTNVSERGMFVSTPDPLEPGAAVRLRVHVEAFSVPLRGVVVWNRRKPEPGRPPGMGVRIFQPSRLYTEFVAHLP